MPLRAKSRSLDSVSRRGCARDDESFCGTRSHSGGTCQHKLLDGCGAIGYPADVVFSCLNLDSHAILAGVQRLAGKGDCLGTDSSNATGTWEQQLAEKRAVPASARVKFFTHGAQEILLVDFSYSNVAMVKAVSEECRKAVAARQHASVRTLVDITEAWFDKQTIDIVSDLAKHNRPYVVKSAVLGVMGLRQIAFNAVVSIARREMKMFNTREQALEWLAG